MIIGKFSLLIFSSNSILWEDFSGKNPKKIYFCADIPELINAVIGAEGPGIGMISHCLFRQFSTNSQPGSLMVGDPASEINAMS